MPDCHFDLIVDDDVQPTTAYTPLSLCDIHEVSRRTTLSSTTIWRAVKAGTFPQPVRVSKNRVAWESRQVDAWIIEQRRKG